jgi:hypothetical protein
MSKRVQPILADALPDLVVGLMGIPVAFSLQMIMEKVPIKPVETITIREFVQIISLLNTKHAFQYMSYVLWLYGFYSIVLLVSFEVSVGGIVTEARGSWQTNLTVMSLLHFPLATAMVITVMAIGNFYQPDQLTNKSLTGWFAWLSLSLFFVSHIPAVVLSWRRIWQEYRTLTAFYTCIFCGVFPLFFLWWYPFG